MNNNTKRHLLQQHGYLPDLISILQDFSSLCSKDIKSLDEITIDPTTEAEYLNEGGYDYNRGDFDKISIESPSCKFKRINCAMKTAQGELIYFFYTKQRNWTVASGNEKDWLYYCCDTARGFQEKQKADYREKYIKLNATPEFYAKLAKTAFYEKWDEKDDPTGLLKNYIEYTLQHLKDEGGKILESEDKKKIVFNTGLFNRGFEPIVVTATKIENNFYKDPDIFNGNKKAFKNERYIKEEKDGKPVYVDDCNDVPFANYCLVNGRKDLSPMEKAQCLIFNPDLEIETQGEEFKLHISDPRHLERINIEPELKKDPDQLRESLNVAKEKARKIARQNYKLVVPQWDFKSNSLQFLMPIYLKEFSGAPNCSLVLALETTANGQAYYLAKTVLDLEQSYKNARLIAKPDSAWLTPENLIAEQQREKR